MERVLVTLHLLVSHAALHTRPSPIPGSEPNSVCCLPFPGFCLSLCPRAPSILILHPTHQCLGEEQPVWLHSTLVPSPLALPGSLLRRREAAREPVNSYWGQGLTLGALCSVLKGVRLQQMSHLYPQGLETGTLPHAVFL